LNNNISENSKDKLSRLDELSDINQKIAFCTELLKEKLSPNSDPKILDILKILEVASVKLTDCVVSLRDELDE